MPYRTNLNIKPLLQSIAPIYANLATEFPQVRFLRVDVDRHQPIAAK